MWKPHVYLRTNTDKNSETFKQTSHICFRRISPGPQSRRREAQAYWGLFSELKMCTLNI